MMIQSTSFVGKFQIADIDLQSPRLASLFRYLFDSRILFENWELVDYSDAEIFAKAIEKYKIGLPVLRKLLGYHLGLLDRTEENVFHDNEARIENLVYRGILVSLFIDERFGFYGDGINMMSGLKLEDYKHGFNSALLLDLDFEDGYKQGIADMSGVYDQTGDAIARYYRKQNANSVSMEEIHVPQTLNAISSSFFEDEHKFDEEREARDFHNWINKKNDGRQIPIRKTSNGFWVVNPKDSCAVEDMSILDTMNDRGNGVWIGWNKSHGWVFLDRREIFNKVGETYYFYKLPSGETLSEESAKWKANEGYQYFKKRLAAIPTKQREEAENELVQHCLTYRRHESRIRSVLVAAHKNDIRKKALQERQPYINRLRLLMLNYQRADKDKILNFITQRKISVLCHFTSSRNLPNILTLGLLPLSELPGDVDLNDTERHDAFPESVSLTVTKPNKKLLDKWSFYKYQSRTYVLLHIDPSILIEAPSLFFPSNAAKGSYKQRHETHFMGFRALEAMFGTPNERVEALCVNDSEPMDEQAEVLVFGRIAPAFIKKIVFFKKDESTVRYLRENHPSLAIEHPV